MQCVLGRTLTFIFHRHRRADLPCSKESIVRRDGANQILLYTLRCIADSQDYLVLFVEQSTCLTGKYDDHEPSCGRQQDVFLHRCRCGASDNEMVVLFRVPMLFHKLMKFLECKRPVCLDYLSSNHFNAPFKNICVCLIVLTYFILYMPKQRKQYNLAYLVPNLENRCIIKTTSELVVCSDPIRVSTC